jgi:hypothetical protein
MASGIFSSNEDAKFLKEFFFTGEKQQELNRHTLSKKRIKPAR